MTEESQQRIAQLEAELATSRAEARRFRQIADGAPGTIYVIDLTTRAINYFNHDELLGYSPEELEQPGSLMALVHPDDIARVGENWQQAAAGQSAEVEYRLRSKAGPYEWVAARSVPLPGPDGQPAALLVYLEVITARLGAVTEIGEWKRRVEMLVDASGQIVYDYDVASGAITWSGAVEQLLGFQLDEMEGGIALWADLIHIDDAPQTFRILEDAERECRSFAVEYRFRRKDGSYAWLYDRGFYMPGPDAKAERMLGMMQDVTGRKEAEEQRLYAQEALIEAQRAALRELSTPLIPVSDDVVVLPLIGAIDSTRAQQVMEALLVGVGRQRARVAILDITGVAVVDTQVANALIQAAQAVRLLGAQVVLTGIRPEVAQTLVGLGVDLRGITTRSTLQDGIASVLRQ